MKKLYASIPGITETPGSILGVSVNNNHTAQLATANIECISTDLDVGDDITIDLGYTDDHGLIFTGYVKTVEEDEGENHKFTITASDVLVRASDYFIVSTTPNNPYKTSNISPEDLIGDLLGMAGITDYEGEASSYVWGVAGEIEVQLVSAYDYSKMLADMIMWGFWADEDGTVHFAERKPFPMDGDPVVATIANTELITINEWKSDKNLRNRVILWGSYGVYAEAKEESPYLPAGFYKTAAASAPGLVDDQAQADMAVAYNLELYNRLTQGYIITAVGNHLYNSRSVVHLDHTDEDLYIFSSEHNWSKSGYVCNLELRKE